MNASDDTVETTILRESLRLRCAQTRTLLPGIGIGLAAVLFGVWGRVDHLPILAWAALLMGALGVRRLLALRLLTVIDTQPASELRRWDKRLLVSSLVNQALSGASIWFALPERDLLAASILTLFSAVFAVGALINLASASSAFFMSMPLTMAQPMVYWALWGPDAVGVVAGLLMLSVLMFSASRQATRLFSRSVRMRLENTGLHVEARRRLEAEIAALRESARLRQDVDMLVRHDIKSPLGGALGLLRRIGEDESLPATARRQLHLVEKALSEALGTVGRSQELLKIESGRFALEARPVDIAAIAEQLAALARIQFATKQLTIAVTVEYRGGCALGDAGLSFTLLQNLLTNACQAAPPGGGVDIVVTLAQPVRIEIDNPGVVPAAIRDDFFGKFVSHGSVGGNGLGTYSARLLAEAQGGRVHMQTDDNSGRTLLTVELPAMPATAA